jgi:ATP-dependent DNA helicase RecG
LVYDELMLLQLALGLSKRMRDGRLTAPVLRIDKLLDERIRKRFPFDLTNSQTAAVYEIVKDLQSGRPMNRLLQGDVGSGKTVVALYAMLVAVVNKMQSAILAPTEVLAEQHYLTLTSLLRESSVRIELFTHRTKRESRGKISKALAGGEIHIAVGTQALIQDRPRRRRRAAQAGRPPARAPQDDGHVAALPGDDGHAHPAHAGAVVLRGL